MKNEKELINEIGMYFIDGVDISEKLALQYAKILNDSYSLNIDVNELAFQIYKLHNTGMLKNELVPAIVKWILAH